MMLAYSKATFGRYLAKRSPVHELDARVKLLSMCLLVIILFVARDFAAMGVIALFTLIAYAIARITPAEAARAILPLAFIIVLTAAFNLLFVGGGAVYVDLGWVRITSDGVESACFMGSRLILLLLIGSLLTLTTTSIDITRAIGCLLLPLARIGVPVNEFAFVMGTALRFLPQFSDELSTIRAAQASRGAKLATSPRRGLLSMTSYVVPLFASVFRHADTLSAAMESRCYAPGSDIRYMSEGRLGKRDALCMAVILALGVTVALI